MSKESLETKYIKEFYFLSKDLFCIANSDGYFTELSHSWVTLLGHSIQELLSKPYIEFIHPDDREATQNKALLLYSTHEVINFENRFQKKDGNYIWLSWHAMIRDKSIIANAANITELKSTQSQYKGLLSAVNHLMSVVEFDLKGNILTANEVFLKIMNYQLHEVIGKHHSMFLLDAQQKTHNNLLFWNALRQGELKRGEFRYLTKNHESVWIMGTYTPVFNADQEPARVIHLGLDTSSKAKSYMELEDFKAVLDEAAIVSTTDIRGKITYVNKKFSEISKYSEKELLGKDHRIINSNYHPKAFFSDLWKTISSGKIWRGEMRNKAKDGTYYWVASTIAPMSNLSGRIDRYLSIRFDISKNKKNEIKLMEAKETALAATKAQSNFLTTMSHEIRTPLNAIIGMTDLTLETQLSPEQKENMDIIKLSADSLLAIINDILDFSKIEAGKIDIEMLIFDLRELLENCQKIFSHSAKKKGVQIILDYPLHFPSYIKGDSVRVRQILFNLISNAIKFTPRGQVLIKVTYLSPEKKNCRVRFDVEDTGIGMPESVISRLFQAFTQADQSTSHRFEGTGLGLSISKKLLEMMGGTIDVKSKEGVGSTFSFEIPFEIANTPIVLDEPEKLTHDKNAGKVLLAEDNMFNQKVALKYLENFGYDVDSVMNGNEVLEAVQKTSYDVILMDCQMPEMDGYEVTRLIRTSPTLEKVSKIPIIAITANAISGDEEECLATGMNDYIKKPIDYNSLNNKINKLIKCESSNRNFFEPIPISLEADEWTKVISKEAIEAILSMDPKKSFETLNNFIGMFLKMTPEKIQIMQSALKNGESKTIFFKAHGLKSSAGYVGAGQMQIICQIIEDKASKSDLSGLESLFQQLASEYSKAETALLAALEKYSKLQRKSA